MTWFYNYFYIFAESNGLASPTSALQWPPDLLQLSYHMRALKEHVTGLRRSHRTQREQDPNAGRDLNVEYITRINAVIGSLAALWRDWIAFTLRGPGQGAVTYEDASLYEGVKGTLAYWHHQLSDVVHNLHCVTITCFQRAYDDPETQELVKDRNSKQLDSLRHAVLVAVCNPYGFNKGPRMMMWPPVGGSVIRA